MLAPQMLELGHRVSSWTRLGRHNSSLTFPGWGAYFSKDRLVLDIVSTSYSPGGFVWRNAQLAQGTLLTTILPTPWHCPVNRCHCTHLCLGFKR